MLLYPGNIATQQNLAFLYGWLQHCSCVVFIALFIVIVSKRGGTVHIYLGVTQSMYSYTITVLSKSRRGTELGPSTVSSTVYRGHSLKTYADESPS